MAARARVREGLTLEQFLRLPDIEESPGLEYIDGRIEAKVAPQKKHNVLTKRLVDRFDAFAKPLGLGEAFPELRCTFQGRSIIPDVVFLLDAHIECDAGGEYVNETLRPPDIHVEIVSPEQSVRSSHKKLLHSTAHGCALGLLINPERQRLKTIDVYRPGREPERLAPDGMVEGEPVLPGFRLPVAEVFGWLVVYRRPGGVSPA